VEKSSSKIEDGAALKDSEQQVPPGSTVGGRSSAPGAIAAGRFCGQCEVGLGDVYITEQDFRVSLFSMPVCSSFLFVVVVMQYCGVLLWLLFSHSH